MSTLIDALRDPLRWPHAVDNIRVIETHISWVLLTGAFAYKIKKPRNLGFLDYSTLAQRSHFCHEELRVNRRFAPALYLEVVAITGTPAAPSVGGDGVAIEYAVRMRQFDDDALLAGRAGQRRIAAALWVQLGRDIARVHAALPVAAAGDEDNRGTPGLLRNAMAENFRQVRAYLRAPDAVARLNRLEEHAWQQWRVLETFLWRRYESGWVRECHGDLHLGNIALIDGRAVPFDAIEFNPGLSWIDVINELAFLLMDCESRGERAGGFVALNAYLEQSGDYAGLRALDCFLGYRAMVRAKVSLLGSAAPLVAGSEADLAYQRYIALADSYTRPRQRFMAITCGVSGSGKSTMAEQLAGATGAIRLRSDVERKRLFGLAPEAASREQDIYTPAASERTFARLAELATQCLADGFPVIVDATFIRRDHREPFRRLAAACGVAFHVLLCDAPPDELRRRVARRRQEGSDASEADVAVLEAQLQVAELPGHDSEPETLLLDALTLAGVAQTLLASTAA
jgi:uncharacterized protein